MIAPNQPSLAKVDILIRVLQDSSFNTGTALIVYGYKGKLKRCYFSTLSSDLNRSIILACITALQGLKKSCEISMFVQRNIGFDSLLSNDSEIKKSKLEILLQETIQSMKHFVHFCDCSDSTVFPLGETYQIKLDMMMKQFEIK
ncbi:hypothetical protein ABC382_00875 [Lysinibacillus sp. 1P01SD]|uniref:hypothetical protein n=1 Tax=Lysinibacillus sp. 1P01SD TaxID=3132285 RepID=UPI00399F8E5C